MGQQIDTTVPTEQLERHVEEWLDEHDAPGVGVAVVDGDETLFADGFGNRRLDPDAPATADTRWGIGSATKPVTATAVMQLVERGGLALDDAVPDYVPYFEDAPGKPVTVGDLLSHTSGIPSTGVAGLVLLDQSLDVDVEQSIDGWEAFRKYVDGASDRRLTDEQRVIYYNAGYSVLSRIVEAVTGEPFADYVERAVFEPLGMDRSTFDVDVLDDDSRNVMTPYYNDEDGIQPASLPESPAFEAPGGLVAPVTDLGKFVSAQISGGAHLDDSLRERMYEPVGTFREFVGGVEQEYGYGWMTRPFGSEVLVGHDGGTGVSGGYVGFLRESGLGVAVGCNGSAPTAELAMELLAAITDRDPATVLPERAIEQKVDGLSGDYESYSGLHSVSVEWTGDRLEIDHESPMGAETHRLAPTSLDPADREFATVEGGGDRTTAEFFVDDDVELLIDRLLLRRIGGGGTAE